MILERNWEIEREAKMSLERGEKGGVGMGGVGWGWGGGEEKIGRIPSSR